MKEFKIIIFLFLPFLLSAQNEEEKIQWLSMEEAVELNKLKPRKFMIYLYSDNCGWCKRMERETFSDSLIMNYINRYYYPVKINKNIKREIRYNNRSFKYIQANPEKRTGGYHELVAILLEGRLAFPSIAYLDENMVYLGVERGYRSIDPFREWLKYIAEGIYKTGTEISPGETDQ